MPKADLCPSMRRSRSSADAAEAEIARLKEQLAQRGGAAPESSG